MLVAPVPRAAIVAGQDPRQRDARARCRRPSSCCSRRSPYGGLGAGTIAALLAILALLAFGLTGLGFLIAWTLDSTQGFHAIMNLFLVPMWLLSGALFPASGAAVWMQWLMWINPLTYGVSAVRSTMLRARAAGEPSLAVTCS